MQNNKNLEELIFSLNWWNNCNVDIVLESSTIHRRFLRTGLYKAIGYSKKDKICAAYCIFHIETGFGYAGSTGHLGKRLNTHRTMLNCKVHDNGNLQDAFNNSNKQFFDILIVFTENREEAYDIEQIFINILKTKKCAFNNSSEARHGLRGKEWTTEERLLAAERMRNRIISDETRLKLSMALLNKIASNESRQKMSLAASTDERKDRMRILALACQKPISINNVKYDGIESASRILNIGASTLKYRVGSSSAIFKEYFYLDKED